MVDFDLRVKVPTKTYAFATMLSLCSYQLTCVYKFCNNDLGVSESFRRAYYIVKDIVKYNLEIIQHAV